MANIKLIPILRERTGAGMMDCRKALDACNDDVEKAILKRQPFAEAFEPYRSMKERKYPYYRIYVKNYIIFWRLIKWQKKSSLT